MLAGKLLEHPFVGLKPCTQQLALVCHIVCDQPVMIFLTSAFTLPCVGDLPLEAELLLLGGM